MSFNVPTMSDYRVENHLSVVLVTPISQDAKNWIEDNVPGAQWYLHSLVVEPRYVGDLLGGMQDHGLVQE